VHYFAEYQHPFLCRFENARVLSVTRHFSIGFENASVLFVTEDIRTTADAVERVRDGRPAGSEADFVALARNSLIDDHVVDLAAHNNYEGCFS
jgi:2,4-dienoyl-CoA reductase-like NADH-dependent reductase (Old Yellow Enzyme family)